MVASGTALFAAAVLTGCGNSVERDHQGVCVDKSTQKRVADDECDEDDEGARSGYYGGTHAWRLYGSGLRFPPVGGRIADYPGSVSTLPSGHGATFGGAERNGGTVSKSSVKTAADRGGFGKTSRSSSGSVGG
ncbi:hypothetical protein GCM10027456_46530 [Kineosporia babensis]